MIFYLYGQIVNCTPAESARFLLFTPKKKLTVHNSRARVLNVPHKKQRALTRSHAHTLTSIMANSSEERDAKRRRQPAESDLHAEVQNEMKAIFAYSAAMQRDMDAVLAYSSRIEDGEPNRFVELKIFNVWTLTRSEDDDYRIAKLTKMKNACKAAQADVKKKRLNWAIAWIDEMITNIKTGEEFDDTLDAGRYPGRGY